MKDSPLLAGFEDPIEWFNPKPDFTLPDFIRRLPVTGPADGPVRLSAEVRTEGVTGTPGMACSIFFNLEYESGPIFWDVFLYPETGTTPWTTLSCHARARGRLITAEMHVRFHAKGRLSLRNLRVEALPAWTDDADALVAVFGDSTDQTCYLPTEHRLTRRLELLLRDRFLNHRVDVHGLAEGGETLKRLIESGRLDRELQALPRCDVATIRFGLNDRRMTAPKESFTPLLHDACDRILKRFPKAQIVISTTLPAEGSAVFDQQAIAVAQARNLPLIRLDEHMRARSAAGEWDWHNNEGHKIGRHREQNPPENPDGLKGDLHPNAYGSQMVAEHYFEMLEPILKSRLESPAP